MYENIAKDMLKDICVDAHSDVGDAFAELWDTPVTDDMSLSDMLVEGLERALNIPNGFSFESSDGNVFDLITDGKFNIDVLEANGMFDADVYVRSKSKEMSNLDFLCLSPIRFKPLRSLSNESSLVFKAIDVPNVPNMDFNENINMSVENLINNFDVVVIGLTEDCEGHTL